MILVVRLEIYEEKNEILEDRLKVHSTEREMYLSLTAYKYRGMNQGDALVIASLWKVNGAQKKCKRERLEPTGMASLERIQMQEVLNSIFLKL